MRLLLPCLLLALLRCGPPLARPKCHTHSLLLRASCSGSAQGVYFYVIEGQQRCFIEEVRRAPLSERGEGVTRAPRAPASTALQSRAVMRYIGICSRSQHTTSPPTPAQVPAETLVVGSYRNPDWVPFGAAAFTGVGLRVSVRDPASAPVLTRDLDTEGKFAMTTVVGGEFQICFTVNSTRWFGAPKKFRLDLSLDVGEGALNYEEIAKKEHLSEVETEVRRLTDKVRDIIREQAYQREREVQFRKTSESTRARLQYWSILQVLVMVGTAVFTVSHLGSFFARKKLT
jgi:hypothetical protein